MKKQGFKIGAISAVLVAQAIAPIAVLAETTPSNTDLALDLDILQEQDVDIVLTIGDSLVNGTNFKKDILEALKNKGVDSERVNVQSIETKAQNLQTSFNWNKHVSSSVGSIAIQNSGTKLQMYGNPKNAGFNKIFTDNNQDPNLREQSMKFDFSLDFGDSFDGAGVLINTHVTNGLMNGYALFFPKSGNDSILYQITNWNSSNSQDITTSPNARMIGTFATGKAGSFELKTTKKSVSILKSGQLVGSIALPNHYGWGVGFFSDHYSHGCNNIGEFSLNNISLSQTSAKDFKESIRQPEWRDNTARFVVNLEDQLVPDFESPSDSGEILTRLINEDIHYIGMGTNTNKAQAENFIKRNDNKGTFVANSNYTNSINSIADYIVEQLTATSTVVSEDNPYFLVGTPLSIQTNPQSLTENTQTEEFPNGRWKANHTENYFENPEGKYELSGLFQKDIPTLFKKPGQYELIFGNTIPSPHLIYAHRRPVAAFELQYAKTGEGTTVTAFDNSYDPDNQTAENKGILEHQWRWKETTSTEWNEGQIPANIPEGKNYILELKVKDMQGVWSLPVSNYITTDSSITPIPIANFTSLSEIDIDDTFEATGTSYDPSGKRLTTKTWTIQKDGQTVYTGNTLPTSFSEYGIGQFKVSLVVTSESGKTSAAYSRIVKVVEKAYNEVLEELTKINESVKIADSTMLVNIKEDLANTTLKANSLKDTANRTSAVGELNKVTAHVNAGEKVIEAEVSSQERFNSQEKIDEAKAIYESTLQFVNTLPAHSVKDALLARLQKVIEQLQEAEENLFKVEIKPDSSGAYLEWQPHDFEGENVVQDYRIIVKQLDKNTGEFTKNTFDRTSKTTTFDLDGLIPGETYLFEVYPRENGVVKTKESITSTIIDVPMPEVPPVPTVQNVVATGISDTSANITWDAYEGAKRYRVQTYVKDPATGTFVKEGFGRAITTASMSINTLTVGNTYKFEVTPYVTKFDDAMNAFSNEITLAAPVIEEPEVPTVDERLQVQVEGTTANLSWSTQTGEDRYRLQLYVKNSSGLFEKTGFARAIAETTFTYTGLTPGLEYKFEVEPRVGYMYDSTKSFSKTLVIPTGEQETSPSEPVESTPENTVGIKNIVADMQGNKATISWDSLTVNNQEITSYRIVRYVKDELTGQFKADGLTRAVAGTSYTDTYKLTSGQTYKYEIIPRVETMYNDAYKGTAEFVNP